MHNTGLESDYVFESWNGKRFALQARKTYDPCLERLSSFFILLTDL